MDVFLAALCALLGLAIGSFLNVVIHRVPRGESVVSPPSACPQCGNAIRPRDNVPVLGWLLLKGKCRDCSEPISARYPLVEALTGVLFAVMALRFGLDWVLPAFLYLAAVGLALALIDLDTKRLPDALTLPSYVVGAVLLGVPAVLDDRGDDYVRALLGAAVMFGLYFALCFAYPAGMGFGDVKLSGVLGLYLGFLGWGELVVGLFLGFFLGGVFGIALMAVKKGGRKTAVPFGPFMLLGVLVAVLVGGDLAQAYRDLIGV
ncbi:MAG: prepilin peptidase [Mycobacteriales bacterium]|nr:prepilin peptidase [Mycobacteriales bacterium]